MHFQNPHRSQPASFVSLVKSIHIHRQLIIQMVKREVVGRYKGSVFGLAWSFLNPILMLTIYTFVFSVVFKARWGEGGTDSKTQFALLVFVGMIVLGLFTEAVNRSPGLILGNTNYVKKVVFPLEILPVISLGAALFHAAISFLVLTFALVVINHELHWTIVFAPLIFAPLIFFTLGITWMLASLGVFMRDVGQTIGILTTVLMFMSPVFYPISALPVKFQGVMMLNPLTFIIEQTRTVAISGQMPNWSGLAIYTLVALAVMWFGYVWFQKTRKGFADVL
ncbi:MAG: sugar ABC transporter permease [Polynucleobacter sp. 24-46-87]|jgi:lipopolysaccharide transport system permease protein|nr:MAG: sugar ABC transporter permease [Polynucleobacter sp. 35-46-207]OZA13179.1 MAG: sugar ABC transporter permease [Polynucleobacter sp. 24-46-87]OZB48688.1 MAG: sugar ABC transporter permease [Polynucleobacter sp. 39-45-136]